MRYVRWTAVAATALMSLLNIPIAFEGNDDDIATPVAVLIAVLGLLGLLAAYGLARRRSWGRPAVLAVGAANLAGAVVALVDGAEGAAIGLVLSLLIVVLAFLSSEPTRTPALG